MTTGPATRLNRRALIAVCCLTGLAVVLATVGSSAVAAPVPIGPDVTVFTFNGVNSYGSDGSFAGYSIGTTSCNRGEAPLNWCTTGASCAPGAVSKNHPVIAQNLYRLKDGRFQQVGMSWLKHGFLSTNTPFSGCSGASGQACQSPPAGSSQLGIGCSDAYSANLNGNRSTRPLGRRSEVNGTTGDFPFPTSSPSASNFYDQRIKVAVADVDPAQNAGATYWAEGQYIASDDAASGNSFNNASHRQVTVTNNANFSLTLAGTFFEQLPAIFAWPAHDIGVILVNVDVPGPLVERFYVGRKVTDLGKGLWHYEYAVHNLNSDRSARALSIEFPVATAFTNAGFKGIAHHSGEPYATDDWAVSSTANALSWSTADFATDPNAHALRFSTMFNFWFDADQPPSEAMVHTLGLFKPGDPSEVEFGIVNNLFSDDLESGGIGAWSSHR